jgi:hypothetical protein
MNTITIDFDIPNKGQMKALYIPHGALEGLLPDTEGHLPPFSHNLTQIVEGEVPPPPMSYSKACELLICLDNSSYEPEVFFGLKKFITHFIANIPSHYQYLGTIAYALGTTLYNKDDDIAQMPTQYSMSYCEVLRTLIDYVNQMDHTRQCQVIFISCSKEATRPLLEVGEALMALNMAANRTRLRIHCIGVGRDHDPYLLEKLSLVGSGGSYRFLKITKADDIGPMMEQATKEIYYSYSIGAGEVCPLSIFTLPTEHKMASSIYYLTGAPAYILIGYDQPPSHIRVGDQAHPITIEASNDPTLANEALVNYLWRNLRGIVGHINNMANDQTLANIEAFIETTFDKSIQDMDPKMKSFMKKISINVLMATESARVGALDVIQFATLLDSFYTI